MYEKIPTAGMDNREWLALRKTGIGGSDAGTLCGLNPYSSPVKLFYDKTTNHIEETENESTRQGKDLEDYVARRFMEAAGLKVRRSKFMYRSKEHPFMIADVDRLVAGQDAGLECKTANAYNADKWKDGKVPPHYLMQCYHYMAVTGKRAWYIAAVILGIEFVYYKLEWDDGLIDALVTVEQDFWENHVLTGVVPEPDGSKACDTALTKHFRRAKEASAVQLVGFDDKLDRRAEILEQISGLQLEQSRIEQEVKLFMQDNELASSEKYHVSWSNVDTARLDTKRLKEEHPEVYRDYVKLSETRRFQVKAA